MSNALNIALVISGMVSGTVQSAIGGVQKSLNKLGDVTKELTARQQRLGSAIKGLSLHDPQLVQMQNRYKQIGSAIDLAASKQKRLNDLIAKGAAIKTQQAGYKSALFEATGQAVAIGAPVLKSVQLAGGFEDKLRDISITGDFSKAEEAQLGKTIRDNSLKFNQTQEDLSKGIGVLVAGGISSSKELAAFAPVLAKAATATRASVEDLGSVFIAMRDNLKITAKDSESALNMLAYAGKKGQFEIKDMAKWLPNLAPQMAALGLTGKEAVAEIGAALQVARKGAGTNDEAANNFRNFLAKVTAPDTIKDFQKAGIDLKGDLIKLREQGMTPMQGMLHLITQYMGTKGPEAAGQFTKALAIKDDVEREAAIARLKEAYKLGELFQDMQAMNFIKPAIANAKELADIKKGAMAAGGDDLLGTDLAKRMEGFNERWKSFTIRLKDLGISLGNTLLPPLTTVVNMISPLVSMVGTLITTFPRLTGAVVGVVSGLLLAKVAVLGFLYLKTMITGFFVSVQTFSALASAKLGLFRISTLLAGGAMKTLSISMLASPVGLAIAAIAVGALLIVAYWKPIKAFFAGIWQGLKEGFKPVADGFARLGITGKAVSNALAQVGGFLKQLGVPLDFTAGTLKKATSAGVLFGKALAFSIKLAFAPITLLGKLIGTVAGWIVVNWRKVLDIFLIVNPITRPFAILNALVKKLFSMNLFEAGKNIFKTLAAGMNAMINAPVETMKAMVTKLRRFLPFSPAKEGPLRDIHRVRLIETIADSIKPQPMVTAMRAVTAATMLAATPIGAMAMPAGVSAPAMQVSGKQSGGNSIVFAPVINLAPGTPAEVKQQIDSALDAGFREWEDHMKKYQRDSSRKRYA
jgi:TP901 family phage tail tape measure protein